LTTPPSPKSHGQLRLSKLMSERGICSRREAEDYMTRGLVYVNGVLVTELGTKVEPDVRITLGSEALQQQRSLVTILVNKPIGFVSAQPEKGYRPAIELIRESNYFAENQQTNFRSSQTTKQCPLRESHFENLAVAGRLDIDSQGLLIFTQDGRLAKKLIGENSQVEKEYLVRFSGDLTRETMKLLEYGLELDGKKLKPAVIERINPEQLRFILKEGRKRQIRRMCDLVNLKVLGLKRVRVGKLPLGPLPEGCWRYLGPHEEI
jgi:23S rRNA pseudouridine2604 synthase